jgi:hypothetical protein
MGEVGFGLTVLDRKEQRWVWPDWNGLKRVTLVWPDWMDWY